MKYFVVKCAKYRKVGMRKRLNVTYSSVKDGYGLNAVACKSFIPVPLKYLKIEAKFILDINLLGFTILKIRLATSVLAGAKWKSFML